MKAEFCKQHTIKIVPKPFLDQWGDVHYQVADKEFKETEKSEALKYAKELMEIEFRDRYLKGVKNG